MDTPKFCINYLKSKTIDWRTLEDCYQPTPEDIEFNYNPFSINNIQNYNPIYSTFFKTNEKNYDNIVLNHKFHFQNDKELYDPENLCTLTMPIFIKYSPLLDPYRFMTGKYKNNTGLNVLPHPYLSYSETDIPKLRDPNNASYVDNFFSFLASKLLHQYKIVHCLDYYGTFLGVQKVFKVNVSDDIEFLQSSPYFLENVNKSFTMSTSTSEYVNGGSRSNKIKLIIGEENLITDVIHIDTFAESLDESKESDGSKDSNDLDLQSCSENLENVVYEKENLKNHESSTDSSSDSSSEIEEDCDDNSECTVDDCDDNDWETESSVSEEGSEQFAYIKDFPVQLICLERADGTMDELFMNNLMKEDAAASALFQVIMTLIIYQKTFHLTHNDLHTNNIMFSNTNINFLYYKYNKQVYKVPTYGKIFKIIDFGRSIYKFNGHLFCSDSFAVGGDAATQYNTEPYLNEKKPRLDPNYSFDLTRLGCSIYDFIIDDDEPDTVATFDELQKTIYRWTTSDEDKNVLYKRNGEERYPNFKLYKMIARTCHKHTPQEQLKFPFFKQFLMKKIVKNIVVMDVDKLPNYSGSGSENS
jgi:hypothetical protein